MSDSIMSSIKNSKSLVFLIKIKKFVLFEKKNIFNKKSLISLHKKKKKEKLIPLTVNIKIWILCLLQAHSSTDPIIKWKGVIKNKRQDSGTVVLSWKFEWGGTYLDQSKYRNRYGNCREVYGWFDFSKGKSISEMIQWRWCIVGHVTWKHFNFSLIKQIWVQWSVPTGRDFNLSSCIRNFISLSLKLPSRGKRQIDLAEVKMKKEKRN